LREALDQYLSLRRSLGFALREPEAILRRFVAYAEQEGAAYITINLMLRWIKQPSKAQPATKAAWLATVRRFALWQSASDPRTEVPAENLFPERYRRQRPYIYTHDEIERLVQAAVRLPSATGLRGLTYATYLGLLAVTGMRMSEGIALDRSDVDLHQGILTIRCTKFGKSRLIPLHSSTRTALRCYAERRDSILSQVTTPAFFVAEHGTRITQWSVRYNFARISQQVGLRSPAAGRRHGHGPRLHDLRHRFAVRVLVDWYRAGLDVERELPKLSTYLGHVHVNDTYWYIEAVPELLQLATQRLMGRSQETDS
jgi:site-specific recombinase XerD